MTGANSHRKANRGKLGEGPGVPVENRVTGQAATAPVPHDVGGVGRHQLGLLPLALGQVEGHSPHLCTGLRDDDT